MFNTFKGRKFNLNYDTCIYSVTYCNIILYYTVCIYFLLIESFVLHNYIEFNVSHSQQTTSIFLIRIGIQDLIFDMWLQSGGNLYQRARYASFISPDFRIAFLFV